MREDQDGAVVAGLQGKESTKMLKKSHEVKEGIKLGQQNIFQILYLRTPCLFSSHQRHLHVIVLIGRRHPPRVELRVCRLSVQPVEL